MKDNVCIACGCEFDHNIDGCPNCGCQMIAHPVMKLGK